jgi:hypothetical protein
MVAIGWTCSRLIMAGCTVTMSRVAEVWPHSSTQPAKPHASAVAEVSGAHQSPTRSAG